ncbi:MAG: EAL domain-containing protein [Candidatus Omnitrophota bacterium]
MDNIHSLLKRQIKKYLSDSQDLDIKQQDFLKVVNDTYYQVDEERKLLEHSLELSSQELMQRNSDYKKALEDLRESENRYALAAEGSNDGLWDWNLKTNEVYYSPRWKVMIGFNDNEINSSQEEWFKRIHADDHLAVKRVLDIAKAEVGEGHIKIEYRILHKNGTYLWVLTRGIVVKDAQGVIVRMAGSQTDITQNKTFEEELRYSAFHDKLTGLPNKTLFFDRLLNLVERIKRHPKTFFAMLFIDLDRFKLVNDSFGHIVGDQLLVNIANKLKSCLRAGDTVARFGGDEFTVLLEDISNIEGVKQIIDRIQKSISVPLFLEDQQIFVTASIGVVLNSVEPNSPEILLRDADTAMYQAKMQGKAKYVIFNKDMHTVTVTRLQLESELRYAVENHELELFYQPIFSLSDKKIVRMEALLRWHHPKRGLVPPQDFIPLAEETDIIISIGEWVFKEVCRQVNIWRDTIYTKVDIAFNCSPRQFQHKNFFEVLKNTLLELEVNALTLELEITESIAMNDIDYTIKLLTQLKDLGMKIAIDDFGVGYSSLSCLKYFPVNALKIDRTFIKDLLTNETNAALTSAIIILGHGLGFNIVAEGVETEEELNFLREHKCDEVQGFLFARPVPVNEAEKLLLKYNGSS